MVNYLKYLVIAVSLSGLTACDNSDKQAAGSAAPAQAAAAFKGKEITVVDGKVKLQLPEGYTEKAGGTEFLRAYTDDAKQAALVVITAPATAGAASLKDKIKAMEEALKAQDANLEVVKQGSVKVGNIDMEQLTVKMSVGGQKAYSFIATGVVADKQLMLQFTGSQDKTEEFQKEIDAILQTVSVQ